MPEYYVEINLSMSNQYYFLIRAKGNKRIIATSEMYSKKTPCIKIANNLAENFRQPVRISKELEAKMMK